MECLRERFIDGVVLGGRYQTIAPLNHGSFGMVFMARDLSNGDTVAIKCLTKKSAASESCLDLAIDEKSEELALHGRLGQHPNIVSLIDSFETEAHVYLVLEFCPRGDLYEAIRNGCGPLETEHVRRFMLELVDAVAYIHSKGIYHRDIKPENIFLTQSGSMKLGDFGLATTEKWTYETTVGSDRYMSPEQYDSAGAGYSPAQADIWAIGICLLNILFSRNPFTTPTEADPLFLDFSRDKQSLFDVFPSMSQDTYEVIVQCMNLDPSKRSLVGARQALMRVVSFTTLEEALDDFCSAERRTVASANREPLRTPSIQSPQVDTGAFPWTKALQATPPHPLRQLSAIPDDDDSYTEDLFSKSGATTDWCSAGETPSMASILNSSLATSMKSLAIQRPLVPKLPGKVSPMAGSLPISMNKARAQPAMSLVFGRREPVSKSWSDMWEEDIEEEERAKALEALQELNSRTWSQDSKVVDNHDDDNTPRQGLSPATNSSAIETAVPSIGQAIAASNIDDDLVADGFFFQDPLEEDHKQSEGHHHHHHHHDEDRHDVPRYSPPPKRSGVDKWAALGEKRRAVTNTSPTKALAKKTSDVALRTGHQIGNPSSSGFGFASFGHGVWDDFATHHVSNNNHTTMTGSKSNNNNKNNNNLHSIFSYSTHHQGSNGGKWSASKDRVKDFPWNRGRDWNLNWRQKRHDFGGDVEWVGGWQEAHS